MKLLNKIKERRHKRKGYRIKPVIKFMVETDDYLFSFFPTIVWQPWRYRFLGLYGVVDIWWLNLHIAIGKWETLSCRTCKHEEECLENKKRKSFWDDIMAETRNCSDFET